MKRSIAVVAGGYSEELQISVKSAATVMKHLDGDRFSTTLVMIDKTGWYVNHNEGRYEINRNDFSVEIGGSLLKFDAVFIAIHGTPGEDGRLQAYFDMIGMPYSTAGHLAMTLSFDKFACNSYLKHHGMSCAPAVIIRKGDEIDEELVEEIVGLPCFVKPNDGGSSFGVTKVKQADEIGAAIEKAMEHTDQVVIESFLDGTEVTCGIVELKGELHFLPITEIVSENEFFDFEAKYKGASQEITPARISEEEAQLVNMATERCFRLLNLTGLARADFIIEDGEPYLIEINTVPGLSDESLIPQQAESCGWSLHDLFAGILDDAMA